MSGGNDSVFARWSRRKLSSRSTEAPREDGNENPLADAGAEDVGAAAQAATQEEEPAQAETVDPGEPVPRIEDLTAASDLSAFLRKGVPKALKSAALRKMWSLDPAIRDYVGPSEYAWNFNEPGSMPGFGPLNATETVVGFLSKAAGAIEAGAEEETASSEPSPAKPPGDTPIDKPANISHPDADAAEAGETAELLASRSPAAKADRTMAAKEGQTVQPSRQEGSFRPRHGGAMPR